jgi:aryl-alcohol dehydrogenase-like predicted oxidoreductase
MKLNVPVDSQERRLLLPRSLGSSSFPVSALGLGCSRLGSILGLGFVDAQRLIAYALEMGINFFDTADIYGQGDSERFLGRALPRHGVIVATKVGQKFPPTLRAMSIFKRPLLPLLRYSKLATRRVGSARETELPRDFRPRHLRRSVDYCLRRLQRERVDILFLHNPDIATLRAGEALDCLAELQRAGKVDLIGVSCDDPVTMAAALEDTRLGAIQCRTTEEPNSIAALAKAARRGVVIVAREIFGGVARAQELRATAKIQSAVRSAVSEPSVTVTLIGTTNITHLTQCVEALDRHAAMTHAR